MLSGFDRRSFLEMGVAAGAATLAPRWLQAQTPAPADRVAQMRAGGLNTPIKTTKLYDNVYLLQGAGGNMALQTGPEGNILIDASFSTAVPKIREAIGAVSKDPADALINTHWHLDHTDGNEGLHAAGFTIFAHENTRERLSTPQAMKMFGFTLPAAPAGALPAITFSDALRAWHNGDRIDMVHFDPAHTDTDIYIHFQKADVLHVGDIWFNGFYPFIDEGTGGSIGGMIRAGKKPSPWPATTPRSFLAMARLVPGQTSRSSTTCWPVCVTRWLRSRPRAQANRKSSPRSPRRSSTRPGAKA